MPIVEVVGTAIGIADVRSSLGVEPGREVDAVALTEAEHTVHRLERATVRADDRHYLPPRSGGPIVGGADCTVRVAPPVMVRSGPIGSPGPTSMVTRWALAGGGHDDDVALLVVSID